MSTSLHVLKKFWHQVNIRPAACCFDWSKRNQCDGGRTRSEPRCDFLYTWALVIPCSRAAAGDCSEDTLTAALHTWSVPPWQGRSCHTLPSGCVALCLRQLELKPSFVTRLDDVSVSLSLMTCNCGHLDPDLVAHRIAGHQS